MKKAVIGIILFLFANNIVFAQSTKDREHTSKFGPCMGSLMFASLAFDSMMLIHFVAAANGETALKKSLGIQANDYGVNPLDEEFLFQRFRQNGKSIQDAIANQPTKEDIAKYALDTVSSCLGRSGAILDTKATDRCIHLGNIGFRLAYMRANELPQKDAEDLIAAMLKNESDEKAKGLIQNMGARVYGEGSRMSIASASGRKNALLLVSFDEFSQCVNLSK
jgi:hypothetical protein